MASPSDQVFGQVIPVNSSNELIKATFGTNSMQKNLVRCGVVAIALVMLMAADAVCQGHHHHHHGLHRWFGDRGHPYGLPRFGGAGWLPGCADGPLVWDVVVQIPVVQHWVVPAPVFVPTPVLAAADRAVLIAPLPIAPLPIASADCAVPMVPALRGLSEFHTSRSMVGKTLPAKKLLRPIKSSETR